MSTVGETQIGTQTIAEMRADGRLTDQDRRYYYLMAAARRGQWLSPSREVATANFARRCAALRED